MLRIERDRTIKIYYREGFFTRTLWQGLSIALALHLFVFIIIDIKPLRIFEPRVVLSSALVEADLDQGIYYNSITSVSKDIHYKVPYLIGISEPRLHSFPSLKIISSDNDETLYHLTDLPRSVVPEIQITSYGGIANRKIIILNKEKLFEILGKKPCLLNYEVQVDNKTGRIFEIADLNSKKTSFDEKLLELLLKNLYINQIESPSITSGIIEINYTFPICLK